MNFKLIVVLLSFSVSFEAQAVEDSMIYLKDDNFYDGIKGFNTFGIFVQDQQIDEMNDLMRKIAPMYNLDSNSEVKFVQINCKIAPKVCEEQNITDLLAVRFFASSNLNCSKCEPMLAFFEKTVQEFLENFIFATKLKNEPISFVNFFIPRCKFCEKVAPAFKELRKIYESSKNISIYDVNCSQRKKLCKDFDVFSYPTMLLIENGKTIDKYLGPRTLDDFQDYIREVLHKSFRDSKNETEKNIITIHHEESAALDLTKEDFDEVIAEDLTVVLFYYDWCQYCKQINKDWDPLAAKFARNDSIKIARVNCGLYSSLCFREGFGCPTVNVYNDGKMAKKDYYEDQSLDGLTDLVNSYAAGSEAIDDFTQRMKEKRWLRKQKEAKEKAEAAKLNQQK